MPVATKASNPRPSGSSTLAPYRATLDLLSGSADDEEDAQDVADTLLIARLADRVAHAQEQQPYIPTAVPSASSSSSRAAPSGAAGGATKRAPLSSAAAAAASSSSSSSLPRPVPAAGSASRPPLPAPFDPSSALLDPALQSLSIAAAGGSAARHAMLVRSQGKLAKLIAANVEVRRKKWGERFALLGDFYMRKLRHCGWRQSLRMAFEVPALHAAKFAGMGHDIPKKQFIGACTYAVARNPDVLNEAELEAFLEECFETFDVEMTGKVDYREFLASLLFFRIPPEEDPEQLLLVWFRYYDGDVEGGVLLPDFLKLVTTLCVTAPEADRLLRRLNFQALRDAPAHILGLGPRPASDADPASRAARMPAPPPPPSFVDREAARTIAGLTTTEAHQLAVGAAATRGDARAMAMGGTGMGGAEGRRAQARGGGPGTGGVSGRGPRDISKQELYVIARTADDDVAEATARSKDAFGFFGGGAAMFGAATDPVAPSGGLAKRVDDDSASAFSYERETNGDGGEGDGQEDDDQDEGGDEDDDEDDDDDDDRSAGERARDEAMDIAHENPGLVKKKTRQSAKAGDLWQTTATKTGKLARLKRALDRAEQEASDLDAPWNRGVGSLTEVRLRPQSRARAALAHSQSTLFAVPGMPKTMVMMRKVPGVDDLGFPDADAAAAAAGAAPGARARAYRMTPGDKDKSMRDWAETQDDLGAGAAGTLAMLEASPDLPQRDGPLVPALPVRRLTLPMVKYLLKKSPGFLDELQRLRVLRLPPLVRSAYLSRLMTKQVEQARQRYERLRDEVQTRRALTLWRQRQLLAHFSRWKSFVRFVIWERVKVNSMRARRAVRMWFLFRRERRLAKAKARLADAHHLRSFLRLAFRQWVLFHRVSTRSNEAKWAAAVALHRHTLLTTSVRVLADRAKDRRARKHYAAVMALRCMHAWVSATNMWKQERASTEVSARVAESRLLRTKEELERQDREADEAAAYAAETAAYEAFLADAERTKEEERLAKMRADADRKLRDHKITQMQLAAREANYLLHKEEFRSKFEAEWDARINAAVQEARDEAAAYAATKEGKEVMREDAKILLMGETPESVSQAESDFRAIFDMSDGCIHFIRDADLTLDPPRERIDLNMDSMRLKDAVLVSTAHYIAKRGCRMRAEKLIEKEKGWKTAVANEAARVFQQRWLAKKYREQALNDLRHNIEQLVDQQTGAPYYVDLETGRVFDTKPARFRSEDIHTAPDYYIKWDPERQRHVYAHRKIPWKTSDTPPPNFRICNVCGLDFATRRCPGRGCSGTLYCFSCFYSYHPRNDPAWTSHWNDAVRLKVKVLTKAEAEAEEVLAEEAAAAAAAAAASAFPGGSKNAFATAIPAGEAFGGGARGRGGGGGGGGRDGRDSPTGSGGGAGAGLGKGGKGPGGKSTASITGSGDGRSGSRGSDDDSQSGSRRGGSDAGDSGRGSGKGGTGRGKGGGKGGGAGGASTEEARRDGLKFDKWGRAAKATDSSDSDGSGSSLGNRKGGGPGSTATPKSGGGKSAGGKSAGKGSKSGGKKKGK
jgi:hypothetical protein